MEHFSINSLFIILFFASDKKIQMIKGIIVDIQDILI